MILKCVHRNLKLIRRLLLTTKRLTQLETCSILCQLHLRILNHQNWKVNQTQERNLPAGYCKFKMLSDSHDVSQVSLEIKQDDKFFTRIMSKETSMANSSCRVYYGGASGAIPFMWESRPGTPKHTFSDSSVPPLTPPPSYHSNSKSKSKHKNIKPNLLTNIFPTLTPKKTHMSPSASMSSATSSSSSWSSFYSSHSALFINSKFQKGRCFSCVRSPICYRVDDDDEEDNECSLGSPNSTLFYGVKRKVLNGFRGCYLMRNLKNAFLSIVGRGSG